jgi:hypothetical protein
MADYSQGKVYRLYIDGFEDICYIGSTVQELNDRLIDHRYNAGKETYQFASAVLFQDNNDVKIELLGSYNCTTKSELLIKEREWYNKFPNAININVPVCLSPEERRERQNACQLQCYYNNREHRLKTAQAWKEDNKERTKEYDKKRRAEKIKCPECQKEMTRGALSNHKNSVHK